MWCPLLGFHCSQCFISFKETHEKFKRESANESESLKSFTTAIKSEVIDFHINYEVIGGFLVQWRDIISTLEGF